MTIAWVTPEVIELTIEEAAELTNVDLACATSDPLAVCRRANW